MTSARRYHHGNLRQAVLDEAATVVRDRGAAELSLREIAATVGVTHAAPRRHFPGRQDLLDAVAVEGFARLGTRLRDALDTSSDYRAQLRSVAEAHLDFMISEANLVELMFAHKHGPAGAAVGKAAASAFAPILVMFRRGQADGVVAVRDPERLGLVFLATLQGLAGLVGCGVIRPGQLDDLIPDALAPFSGGR
ncbi:TetR/AcrR family transcriptional regulator [Cellulomonas sp. APG4]|uniref:TetR/AcrR family transcriptional regulator n=1 Tax=Cellulomonas sp. APG4 TaxID=1538656 RepID=UPI001379A983|nr:TetR/AcrR family transcriptional regulator [Cellulomonas sp. APG4]NCT90810.1 TetR/AcrR family transcriptional regulator [Cellulomonas sp. APG4]